MPMAGEADTGGRLRLISETSVDLVADDTGFAPAAMKPPHSLPSRMICEGPTARQIVDPTPDYVRSRLGTLRRGVAPSRYPLGLLRPLS